MAREWIERRREAALAWARKEHSVRTGLRKRIAGHLLTHAELLAQGRSFSQVYKVADDGEVLQRRASRFLSVLAVIFTIGSFAAVLGYVVTVTGALAFGMVWGAAYLLRYRELAFSARRMTALMMLATIPILGNAFVVLLVASELNAFFGAQPVDGLISPS